MLLMLGIIAVAMCLISPVQALATKPLNDDLPISFYEQPSGLLSNYLDQGFKLEIFYNLGNTQREAECLILEQNLEALNPGKIDITVTALDWPTYLQYRLEGVLPVMFLGWAPDYADPDDYLNPFYHSYGNFAPQIGYSNYTLDAMIEAAASIMDPDLRAAAYEQISMDMYEECVYIWTDQTTNFHAERDWLTGYTFNPMFCGDYYYPYDKPDTKPVGAPDSYDPDTFTRANLMVEPVSLDPAINYDTVGGEIVQNVYETLVFYNGSSASELVPMLATEVPSLANGGISVDGLTYTYHLRNDVVFHDGTPMTSSDVKYSLSRVLLMNDLNGPAWMIGQVTIPDYYDYGMGYFDGETFYPAENIYGMSIADEIEEAFWCVDDYTLQINLTCPYAPFNQVMAFSVGAVISEDFVEGYGGLSQSGFSHMYDHMCGTGPYQLVDWAYSNYFNLTAYSSYWRTPPAISNVVIQQVVDDDTRTLLLKNGEVDSAYISRYFKGEVEGYPGITVTQGLGTFNLNFLGLNQNRNLYGLANPELTDVPFDFFADKNVRLAFAHAFDYDRYINDLLLGTAIQPNGAIPQGMFGYSSDVPVHAFDLTKAADYLRNATVEVADENPPEVTIINPAPYAWFNVTTVTVDWTGQDNETCVSYYDLILDQNYVAFGLTNDTWTFHDLSEGWHSVSVIAYDESSNFAIASVDFLVDLGGPMVTITDPANGSYLDHSTVEVQWTATDSTSNVTKYTLYLDQQLIAADLTNQSWTFQGLAEGAHEVKVVAFDEAMNAGEDVISFFIDTIVPSVSITAPSDGVTIEERQVTVTWNADDLGSGVSGCTILLDQQEIATDLNNGSWHFQGLADGWHTVEVVAYDLAGNNNNDSVAFLIDTEAPFLNIVTPSNGAFLTVDTVVVTWTAVDNGTGMLSSSLYLDEVLVAEGLTNTTWTFFGLAEGAHTVTVFAYDALLKASNRTATFTVDTIVPTVNITAPLEGTIISIRDMTVAWNADDVGSGIDDCTILLDQVVIATGLTNGTWTFHGLSEGWHTVKVIAYDQARNPISDERSFLVDLGPPVVSILSPADNAQIGSSTVKVDWSGQDAGAGIKNYSLWLDQVLVASGLTNKTWTFHGLSDGMHVVTVFAYDNLSKVSNATADFRVDTLDPKVDITSPVNGSNVNVRNMTVVWSGNDGGSGIASYTLLLDQTLIAQGLTNNTWTFSGLSEGWHTVKVIIYDKAQNTVNDSLSFLIDLGAPTLSITQPANDGQFGNDSIVVTWVGQDAGAGICNYSLWLDQTLIAQGLTNTTWTFHGLADGAHTIKVLAYDNLSKASNASVAFLIDTIAPTVSITSPANGAVINITSMTVVWSGNDGGSGIASYTLYLDQTVIATGLTNTTWTFHGMTEGTHLVKVIAYDELNHSANSSNSYLVQMVVIYHVRMHLTDQDGEPIANANISVDGHHVGVTDANGWITLAVTPGEHEVCAECDEGSETWSMNVTTDNAIFQQEMELEEEGGGIDMALIALIALVGLAAVVIAVVFLRRKP